MLISDYVFMQSIEAQDSLRHIFCNNLLHIFSIIYIDNSSKFMKPKIALKYTKVIYAI